MILRLKFMIKPAKSFSSKAYKAMEPLEKLEVLTKTLKKLKNNQNDHFVEQINILQAEMIKEQVPSEPNIKKGIVHSLSFKSDNSKEKIVKIFEKKIKWDNTDKLYLHIPLQKLSFDRNFMPKASQEDVEALMREQTIAALPEKELFEKFNPSYSLGDNVPLILSKHSLQQIKDNSLTCGDLQNKGVIMFGSVLNEPYISTCSNVIPLTMLSQKYKDKEYLNFLSEENLYEKIILDEQSFKIEGMSVLDKKLRKEFSEVYRGVLDGVGVKFLHFQSLLWWIEETYDKYEELAL